LVTHKDKVGSDASLEKKFELLFMQERFIISR